MHERGDGVPKNYEEARRWYEKAAGAGVPSAMNGLGVLYHNGSGVARDYAEARRWYEKAAAQGNGWAMANLGHLYHYGLGVARDAAQARLWYQRAIATGADTSAADELKKLNQRPAATSQRGQRRQNYGGGDDGWQGRAPFAVTPQGPGYHMGHGHYIVPHKW